MARPGTGAGHLHSGLVALFLSPSTRMLVTLALGGNSDEFGEGALQMAQPPDNPAHQTSAEALRGCDGLEQRCNRTGPQRAQQAPFGKVDAGVAVILASLASNAVAQPFERRPGR